MRAERKGNSFSRSECCLPQRYCTVSSSLAVNDAIIHAVCVASVGSRSHVINSEEDRSDSEQYELAYETESFRIMFVRVQAAVGVIGDTDRMRPLTRDVLNSQDIARNMFPLALSSPARFPKTRLVNSTSRDDNSACTKISNHEGIDSEADCKS